ncbi:MAG: DUF86 domain-containing protein [Desulfobacterales bacterium]|nr:DUF86 domain-containing protein [Desulfobacterales bacterium]
MYDKELAVEILRQIYGATQIILKRFEPIKSVEDFTSSDWGLEKLDAICMQLITIGESLKNLDKVTNNALLPNYPQIEWKKVKGMRDIITHHYFDLNADAIYDVCQNHVEHLSEIIKIMIDEVNIKSES